MGGGVQQWSNTTDTGSGGSHSELVGVSPRAVVLFFWVFGCNRHSLRRWLKTLKLSLTYPQVNESQKFEVTFESHGCQLGLRQHERYKNHN